MDFHFVKLRVNEGYITVTDTERKTRYLCFKERHTASKCLKKFAEYRATYGKWPEMNLTKKLSNIDYPIHFKVRQPKEVERFLTIETLEREQLDTLCKSTDAGFMYCHSFDMNMEKKNNVNLSFSAQDIDSIIDLESVRNTLDFTYFLR